MKVYIFGNKDFKPDKEAFVVAKKIKKEFPQIEFVEVGKNKDLPFDIDEHSVILDTIEGIDREELIENRDLSRVINKSSVSVHDFDLGFQLKYLQKLGKLGSIKIIGIPMGRKMNYLRIQSILRKLVAQDMQGS